MDAKQIEANIKARAALQELLEFVPDVLRGYAGASEDRFWELLAIEAASRVGKVLAEDGPVRGPMTEAEALMFEKEMVPRSYWPAGRVVGEVEPWQWIKVTEDVFSKALRRYLGSAHFRRRQ